MVWLIKEYSGMWKRQQLLESERSSRCYFYNTGKSGMIEAYDRRKILTESNKPYITFPLSVDLDKPYIEEKGMLGLVGDLESRKATNQAFAKSIASKLRDPNTHGRRFLSARILKNLGNRLYYALLRKLEG